MSSKYQESIYEVFGKCPVESRKSSGIIRKVFGKYPKVYSKYQESMYEVFGKGSVSIKNVFGWHPESISKVFGKCSRREILVLRHFSSMRTLAREGS